MQYKVTMRMLEIGRSVNEGAYGDGVTMQYIKLIGPTISMADQAIRPGMLKMDCEEVLPAGCQDRIH